MNFAVVGFLAAFYEEASFDDATRVSFVRVSVEIRVYEVTCGV